MTAATAPAPAGTRFPTGPAVAGIIWFVLAAVAGLSGVLLRLPFPVPQLLIAALFGLVFTSRTLREWVDRAPLRLLVGVNALRVLGGSFLLLAAAGQINATFGQRAGWGDLATALIALALIAGGNPTTAGARLRYHAWNVLGFLDLTVALGTATLVTGVERLFLFPFSVVPFFLVPVFLANHIFIFRRLRRDGRA